MNHAVMKSETAESSPLVILVLVGIVAAAITAYFIIVVPAITNAVIDDIELPSCDDETAGRVGGFIDMLNLFFIIAVGIIVAGVLYLRWGWMADAKKRRNSGRRR